MQPVSRCCSSWSLWLSLKLRLHRLQSEQHLFQSLHWTWLLKHAGSMESGARPLGRREAADMSGALGDTSEAHLSLTLTAWFGFTFDLALFSVLLDDFPGLTHPVLPLYVVAPVHCH